MGNLNKRLVDVLPKYPQWEHDVLYVCVDYTKNIRRENI